MKREETKIIVADNQITIKQVITTTEKAETKKVISLNKKYFTLYRALDPRGFHDYPEMNIIMAEYHLHLIEYDDYDERTRVLYMAKDYNNYSNGRHLISFYIEKDLSKLPNYKFRETLEKEISDWIEEANKRGNSGVLADLASFDRKKAYELILNDTQKEADKYLKQAEEQFKLKNIITLLKVKDVK